MNKKEFIKTAYKRGYCTEGIAKIYAKTHKKDSYTEADLIDLYRVADVIMTHIERKNDAKIQMLKGGDMNEE
jgi:hypothetical protein